MVATCGSLAQDRNQAGQPADDGQLLPDEIPLADPAVGVKAVSSTWSQAAASLGA